MKNFQIWHTFKLEMINPTLSGILYLLRPTFYSFYQKVKLASFTCNIPLEFVLRAFSFREVLHNSIIKPLDLSRAVRDKDFLSLIQATELGERHGKVNLSSSTLHRDHQDMQ